VYIMFYNVQKKEDTPSNVANVATAMNAHTAGFKPVYSLLMTYHTHYLECREGRNCDQNGVISRNLLVSNILSYGENKWLTIWTTLYISLSLSSPINGTKKATNKVASNCLTFTYIQLRLKRYVFNKLRLRSKAFQSRRMQSACR